MNKIIKISEISDIITTSEKEFSVGDYIVDSRGENLRKLTELNSYPDGLKIYRYVTVNPMTLEEREGSTISRNSLEEYYSVLNIDIHKARATAQKIVLHGYELENDEKIPQSNVMSLNSEKTVYSLKSDIEKKHIYLQKINKYCELIKHQLIKDIEKKIAGVREVTAKMEKEISHLKYVIETIETYAGIQEEIIQLQQGEPATEDVQIVIRQGVIFMDEEIALIDDDFDWRKIESFDKWLTTNNNFKILLPDEKSIIAIKPRRTDKKYADDFLYNMIMNQENHVTLFLIRNGENLYRLESEHISLTDRMFPNRDEFLKTIQREAGRSWDSSVKESEVMKRRFTKIAFLLQGLLDRSSVFAPHHVSCNFVKYEGIDTDEIKMDYELDESRLISDGHPSVKDWMNGLNLQLSEGKRIILCSSQYQDFSTDSFIRYYTKWGAPYYPSSGIYTLKTNPLFKSEKHGLWYSNRYSYSNCIGYYPEVEWHNSNRRVNIAININGRGIINYDDLNMEELDYYLNCRLYRSQYYTYVRLLKIAKSIMEKEEAEEANFLNMMEGEIIKKGYEPINGYSRREISEIALHDIKNRLKWKRPISSKERETYTLVKRRLFSKDFMKKYFGKIRQGNEKLSH